MSIGLASSTSRARILPRRSRGAPSPQQQPPRRRDGRAVTVHDLTDNLKFSESSIINIILPFVAAFFFFIATMLAAGYTLGVVANEKENRTMEIMLTSVTPGQMIAGNTE